MFLTRDLAIVFLVWNLPYLSNQMSLIVFLFPVRKEHKTIVLLILQTNVLDQLINLFQITPYIPNLSSPRNDYVIWL